MSRPGRCFPFDAAVCAAYQISSVAAAPRGYQNHIQQLSQPVSCLLLIQQQQLLFAALGVEPFSRALSSSISEAINKRAASSISRALHPPHLVSLSHSVFESSRL